MNLDRADRLLADRLLAGRSIADRLETDRLVDESLAVDRIRTIERTGLVNDRQIMNSGQVKGGLLRGEQRKV